MTEGTELQTDPSDQRSLLRLTLDPVFGPYFVGRLVSTAGVWIHNIAAAIVVFDLTNSAAAVGAVSVALFIPQLLLAPKSGVMADRGSRRRQLLLGRLLAGLSSMALAVWIATVGLDASTGAAVVIAAGAFAGIGYTIGSPAMQALVPNLVRPNEVLSAVALNNVPLTLGRALGPAVGAFLLTSVGSAPTFAIAGLGNIFFALVLLRLDVRDHDVTGQDKPTLRNTFTYIKGRRAIVAVLLGVTAIGFGVDPIVTLTPAIASELGRGTGFVGVLGSSFGVGAGLAFLFLDALSRRVPTPWLSPIGLLGFTAGLSIVAATPGPVLAVAGLGIAGGSMTVGLTALTTRLHELSPEQRRGSIMGFWAVAFVGSRPAAAAINGGIADWWSWRASMTLTAVVLLIGAWLLRPRASTDSSSA